MTLIHRVDEAAEKLAEWFGLSDGEVDRVRSAKAGNDDDGHCGGNRPAGDPRT